jgi:hypothetical protein
VNLTPSWMRRALDVAAVSLPGQQRIADEDEPVVAVHGLREVSRSLENGYRPG